jgi:3-oxoadipate enol-lactonase
LTLLSHTVQGPEDGAPILLLNGGMMSHAAWSPVAQPILDTGRYRTLGCDLRGQVLSPGTPPPTLDGQVEEVVRLLDALDLADTPIHVLGTSFGGEIGLLLAATHPERVRSLAAVTVTDFLDDAMREGVEASRRRVAGILAGGDRSDFQDAVAEEVYSEGFRRENEGFLAAARDRLERMPREWFESLDGILASYAAVDLRPRLGEIRCPVLIVIAAQDRVMPPERSWALVEALPPEAEVAVHPESGHALVLEHPGWLAERYLEFLAGLRREPAPRK